MQEVLNLIKRKLFIVAMLSVILMSGCSKEEKGVLELIDGVIYNNGVATSVVEHTGGMAKEAYAMNPQFNIVYSWHNAFGDCEHNEVGVAIGDVSKSDKDKSITYFSAYNESQFTVHKDMGNYLMCGYLYTSDVQQPDIVINQLTNSILTLSLSSDYHKAILGDIEVHDWNDAGKSIVVTAGNTGFSGTITIPDYLLVTRGSVNTTETREINKQQVGFMSDAAFDYYQYGDYVVQVLKGNSIEEFITFRKPKG